MKRIAIVVLVIIAVAVGGTAAAFWTRLGSGTGTAGSGTTSAVTLTPGVATAGLYPGGQNAVSFTVSNPNATSIRINAFSLDTTQATGGFAVDAAHPGCTLTSLSFPTQTQVGGWTVPGNDSLAVSLPASLALATAAPNACQGASFTVYLKAGV